MLATDRCHYAKYNPYMDSPQSIGKSVSMKYSVLISVTVTAFVIDMQTYFYIWNHLSSVLVYSISFNYSF